MKQTTSEQIKKNVHNVTDNIHKTVQLCTFSFNTCLRLNDALPFDDF